MPKFMIMTVGTSLFTNVARRNSEKISLINNITNLKKNELKDEQINELNTLKNEIKNLLKEEKIENLKHSSAELNGYFSYYNGRFQDNDDILYLIESDTYLCELICELLKDYFISNSVNCDILKIDKFSTKDKKSFTEGIKNLLNNLAGENGILRNYRDKDYKIVFNLTGGFKSLQGYLTTIGMFYADEIVYIFETGNELIKIPKLPIRFDDDIVKKYKEKFLMLEVEPCKYDQISEIPEIFREKIDNKFILNPWGDLYWKNLKRDFLIGDLFNYKNIEYERTFIDCYKNITTEKEKIKLQEVIARISVIYENEGLTRLKKDGGLQYEEYNSKKVNNRPLGHIRVNQSVRISCIENNKKLILRYYGTHDFIKNKEGL